MSIYVDNYIKLYLLIATNPRSILLVINWNICLLIILWD